MKRITIVLAIVLGLLPSVAQAQAACTFVLGFADMAAEVPQVGDCKENQHIDKNGDQVQATTGGLLAWRKADNWTAFTDGYRTWVNGPQGIQQRLNTDRFSWESPPISAITDQQGCYAAGGQWVTTGGKPYPHCATQDDLTAESQSPAAVAAAQAAQAQAAVRQAANDRAESQSVCTQIRAMTALSAAYGSSGTSAYLAALAKCISLGLA